MGGMAGLSTPLDNLNVDFESLLNGFAGGGGSGSAEDFDSLLAGMQGSSDPGAIFVPVDNANAVRASEWGDGTTPGSAGLQQWVRLLSSPCFALQSFIRFPHSCTRVHTEHSVLKPPEHEKKQTTDIQTTGYMEFPISTPATAATTTRPARPATTGSTARPTRFAAEI